MSTRNERRQIKKEIGRRVLDHPFSKRIKRNLLEAGDAATEIYRLDGATPEEHLYFDVYSMRKWATANAEQVISTLCWDRVERLMRNGAINEERLRNHTMQSKMEPIIIGVNAAGSNGDQILDGAHRFVAYAMAASAAGLSGAPLPLPAYLLQPFEWKQFLVPHFIAQALNFDAKYDGDSSVSD